MNWFMVNGISTATAFVSLCIFIITTRKLASTIRLGRELAMHIAHATNSLEKAALSLSDEHQDFRDESRMLAARMTESTRVRQDLERSLNHMEQLHLQLQKTLNRQLAVTTTPVRQRAAIRTHGGNNTPPVSEEQASLPVFVQRRINKTISGAHGRKL